MPPGHPVTATLEQPAFVVGFGPAPVRRSDDPGPRTVRSARLAAGLTVTELARAVHMSRPSVSMWEHGTRRAAEHHWPALGRALGLSPAEVAALFADSGPGRLDGVRLPGLAQRRRRCGMTGRALAAHVEVAPSTLSMWETADVRVPPATADALADVLGCTVPDLARPPVDQEPERVLRSMRRQAHMTGREAAGTLGISLASLARYEAGQRAVPLAVLRRMAVIYRQPAADLLAQRAEPLPRLPERPWSEDDVPAVLHGLRVRAGLSKVAVGRRVGRSGQAVRGWETGLTRPGTDTRLRLEAVFGVPPGSLRPTRSDQGRDGGGRAAGR